MNHARIVSLALSLVTSLLAGARAADGDDIWVFAKSNGGRCGIDSVPVAASARDRLLGRKNWEFLKMEKPHGARGMRFFGICRAMEK